MQTAAYVPEPDGYGYGNGQALRFFVAPAPPVNGSLPPEKPLLSINVMIVVSNTPGDSRMQISDGILDTWAVVTPNLLPRLPGTVYLQGESATNQYQICANVTTGPMDPEITLEPMCLGGTAGTEYCLLTEHWNEIIATLNRPPGGPVESEPPTGGVSTAGRRFYQVVAWPTDSNHNGIPDWRELLWSYQPFAIEGEAGFADPTLDFDSDGLSMLEESDRGTDPFNPDTDGDLSPDGEELAKGTDALDATSTPTVLVTAGRFMRSNVDYSDDMYHWAAFGEAEMGPLPGSTTLTEGRFHTDPYSGMHDGYPNYDSWASILSYRGFPDQPEWWAPEYLLYDRPPLRESGRERMGYGMIISPLAEEETKALDQRRVWLRGPVAPPGGIQKTVFLRKQRERGNNSDGGPEEFDEDWSVTTIEAFTFTVPEGERLSSNHLDLLPSFEWEATPEPTDYHFQWVRWDLLDVDLAIGVLKEDENEDPFVGNGFTGADINFAATIVPADKEDTEGGWAVVNFDDDDDDAGSWGHGQTTLTSDKDDTNGVTGENDLLLLRIKEIPGSGIKYRLNFSDANIKIWKTTTKATSTDLVMSEQTEFTIPQGTKWHALYVEGLTPHNNDDGTIITLQVKVNSGDWKDTDSVKVRVAHPIIVLYGDGGDWNGDRALLRASLEQRAGTDPSRLRKLLPPTTGKTYLVPGNTQSGSSVCYSVTELTGYANPNTPSIAEKVAKIGLQLEGANLIFVGHANYGVGVAFGKNFNSFDQFFNMAGGGYASISVDSFGMGTTAPNHLGMLSSVNGNYMPLVVNDRNQRAANLPLNRYLQGSGIVPNIPRYPLVAQPPPAVAPPAVGAAFPTLTFACNYADGSPGSVKWHYIADPLLDGAGHANDKHTIINSGNSDVPATLRYRSLFINQCNGYRSFIESFRHGTVVSSWACIGNSSLTTRFATNVIDGLAWAAFEDEFEDLGADVDPSIDKGAFEFKSF